MNVLKPQHGGTQVVRPFRIGEPISAGTQGLVTPHSQEPQHNAADKSVKGAPTSSAKPADAAADERLALSRRIAELEQKLADDARKSETAIADAREEGRKLGREEAETKEAERLEALGKALTATRSETLKAFDAQRSLAVDIARATLSQILGDQSAFTGLVSETASYWKAKLAGAAVLKVRVSAADFGDQHALHEIRQSIGNLDLSVEDDLRPGSCVFDLQLGEVDASIPLQAQRADTVLSEYAEGAPAK